MMVVNASSGAFDKLKSPSPLSLLLGVADNDDGDKRDGGGDGN